MLFARACVHLQMNNGIHCVQFFTALEKKNKPIISNQNNELNYIFFCPCVCAAFTKNSYVEGVCDKNDRQLYGQMIT